ncbi:MFS transporter [Streptomyces luteolus]|uniref:MFS transporter n=1 Tax=Streptomyces luteolus TaxID=3043615 RepID=A0ABT6SQY6_9ACTN|nr:MFS transporter [Streptomyces sp. B-S-A12]MDI3418023.1 MFS transporter [Streptomyces sp. B-S-A12]
MTKRNPRLSVAWKVGIAGVAAQGVTFGFARYGYGLFLPEIRDQFQLSVSLVGAIGSATYVSYLAALMLVGALSGKFGPRPLVIAGGLSAAGGMLLVAYAQGTGMLVIGLVMAGLSPGFAWAPYSDAVDRMVPERQRERVMALIPSGTAFAVIIAGPLAVVAKGPAWQYAWTAFAAAALAVTLYNARILPGGPHRQPPVARQQRLGLRWFARRPAIPLYSTALVYGLIGAVYWTFAVDAVSQNFAEDDPTGPLFWTLMGLAGTAGVFTGNLMERLGQRRTQALLFLSMAVAIALLGVAPGTIPVVVTSAVLYGPAFMAGSGLLAVWSYKVFPEKPSTGFSSTVFFLGIGTIIGPAALGAFADRFSMSAAFLLTAGIALLTLFARPVKETRPVVLEGGCSADSVPDSVTSEEGSRRSGIRG